MTTSLILVIMNIVIALTALITIFVSIPLAIVFAILWFKQPRPKTLLKVLGLCTLIGPILLVLSIVFSLVWTLVINPDLKTTVIAPVNTSNPYCTKAQGYAEDSCLKPTKQTIILTTNFGNIAIETQPQAAPKTVESFVRLVYREKYHATVFHRIVKAPQFAVIQGGDFTRGNGTGGESAFGDNTLPDELWKVSPQQSSTPTFRDPSLYQNYTRSNNTVTYRKGLIIMAKTSQPDSAGSQFFITLQDTILPAEYTTFGVILPDSFAVLDKIYTEVNPKSNRAEYPDGEPDKKLLLEKAVILL